MRVLIVNQDYAASCRLSAFLDKKGHSVDLAANATSCLEKHKTKSYQAIAINLALPDMDGITLCRTVRQNSGQDTRILLFGRFNSVDTILKGFAAGADDCLASPFAFAELEARLVSLTKPRHRSR